MGEIQANFEKAYWKLELNLKNDDKELPAATLPSVALNSSERKGPSPLKTVFRAMSQLEKKDDIVITQPDKDSGVVAMNKSDYVHLLKESSVNDDIKFTSLSLERP